MSNCISGESPIALKLRILPATTVTTPVETMQVAPTILKALGLNPNALQSVQQEGTAVLPKSF
jgi:hypothetical protein